MSVSYAVDFASLLLLGPHETMLVAAGSAFSQCHLNSKEQQPAPPHAVQHGVAGDHGAGRGPRVPPARRHRRDDAAQRRWRGRWSARRRSTSCSTPGWSPPRSRCRRATPIVATWHNNFLWSAPSYFVGAGIARRSPPWLVTHAGYWVAPLTFAPLYLTYRTYKVYMGRIDDEQRHVQQTSDLHLATIEALARAIDAKDQTTQMHIRRVQVYATGLAKRGRPVGGRDSGHQDRRAAARHRQARGARAHPVEAGTADAGRVPEDPDPSAGRRRDHRRRAVPVSGGAADPEPPRALGRQGLSAGARRRGRFRSARASSRSSTTTTRSPPSVRITRR